MTKEQFDKPYVGKNLVVCCDTEEKAKEFLELAGSFGYTWSDGKLFSGTNSFFIGGSKICYSIYEGKFGSVASYAEEGYKVITYTANKKEFTKSDLEDGYKVVYRDFCERFVMKRTETLHEYNGNVALKLKWFNENLAHEFDEKHDIMRVYDRQDNLIWERVEKSPQQEEIERIETEMRELADRLSKLKEQTN